MLKTVINRYFVAIKKFAKRKKKDFKIEFERKKFIFMLKLISLNYEGYYSVFCCLLFFSFFTNLPIFSHTSYTHTSLINKCYKSMLSNVISFSLFQYFQYKCPTFVDSAAIHKCKNHTKEIKKLQTTDIVFK